MGKKGRLGRGRRLGGRRGGDKLFFKQKLAFAEIQPGHCRGKRQRGRAEKSQYSSLSGEVKGCVCLYFPMENIQMSRERKTFNFGNIQESDDVLSPRFSQMFPNSNSQRPAQKFSNRAFPNLPLSQAPVDTSAAKNEKLSSPYLSPFPQFSTNSTFPHCEQQLIHIEREYLTFS